MPHFPSLLLILLVCSNCKRINLSATNDIFVILTVGAVVGAGLVLKGSQCIKWSGMIKIAISWVASPVLSGIVAFAVYFILLRVIHSSNPVRLLKI